MKNTSASFIVLDNIKYPLKWDFRAQFKADDIGLNEKIGKGRFGYSTLLQMIWVMLSDLGRKRFPEPEAIGEFLPPESAADSWTLVVKVWNEGTGTEDTDAKKTVGETAPSPE